MVMTDAEILDGLRDAARAALPRGRIVGADADLANDLGLDSMTATALVVAIEDRFQVVLPDDELVHCKRVGDLVGLVRRRLAC
jgi:acyl carrier protein